jgi:zinc protease
MIIAWLLLLSTAQENAVNADEFRTRKPVVPAAKMFTPPVVTRFAIAGTKIDGYLVERHDLPIVTMSIDFDLGRVSDPVGKAGLSNLCMDLLDEGTANLDKNAFELAKADLAISIGASHGRELSSLSLASTSPNLDAGFALLSSLLLTPGMRAADLERLRSKQMAAVMQQRASADSVSARVSGRVLYGEQHPFGKIVTEASLKSITQADCQQLGKRLLPDGARLFVQGDVTVAEIQQLFSSHLSSWRGQGPQRPKALALKSLPGKYFFVDVPGAAQSSVWVAHGGPLRTANDFAATTILGQIVGGSFSSRINMNLREKNGYTYGARGGFSYARDSGLFAVSSSVRSDATEASVREIASELRGMTLPTEVELNREKQGALLAFPAQFATGTQTVSSASDLVFYGLGFDEWTKLPKAYAALDAAAIASAAKQHLRMSEGVVVVIAGDAKIVKPALERLAADAVFGKGAVVELDADGLIR